MNGTSVVTSLFGYSNSIVDSLSKDTQVDWIYLYFSKAFYTLNHNLLIQKLEKWRVRGALLTWFKSYLSDRYQIVNINEILSESYAATLGVAQGSHLGLLLFNIVINDIY